MRPHHSLVPVAVTLAILVQACATTHPTVFGRDVKVVSRAAGPTVQGELIVVEAARLLVLTKAGIDEIAVPQIRQVRVRQHAFGTRRAWLWTLIGAAVSSIGLTAACSSVESAADCSGVAAAGAAPWLLFGGLASLVADRSAFVTFAAGQEERLRPFARYPQGLPPDLDVAAMRKSTP